MIQRTKYIFWPAVLAIGSLTTKIEAECGRQQAFSLPIRNVTLPNGASVRGISIAAGTPAQSLSLLPQWYVNLAYPTSAAHANQASQGLTIRGYMIRKDSVTPPSLQRLV